MLVRASVAAFLATCTPKFRQQVSPQTRPGYEVRHLVRAPQPGGYWISADTACGGALRIQHYSPHATRPTLVATASSAPSNAMPTYRVAEISSLMQSTSCEPLLPRDAVAAIPRELSLAGTPLETVCDRLQMVADLLLLRLLEAGPLSRREVGGKGCVSVRQEEPAGSQRLLIRHVLD